MRKELEYHIDKNGCFICTSHRKSNGYPGFYRNGKHIRINRYVYELYNGEIPPGLIIRHTCDNRACINPKHLIVGTAKDNYQDMINRNRRKSSVPTLIGQNNPLAKLKNKDIEEILKRLKNKESQAQIARSFGVSRTRICEIAHGRAWTAIRG